MPTMFRSRPQFTFIFILFILRQSWFYGTFCPVAAHEGEELDDYQRNEFGPVLWANWGDALYVIRSVVYYLYGNFWNLGLLSFVYQAKTALFDLSGQVVRFLAWTRKHLPNNKGMTHSRSVGPRKER